MFGSGSGFGPSLGFGSGSSSRLQNVLVLVFNSANNATHEEPMYVICRL